MANEVTKSAVASEKGEKVITIPLSDLHVPENWNVRSKVAGGEEGDGFEGTKASIAEKGQDTPIIVRPTPKGFGNRQFSVVCGFQRVEAIKQIAVAGGDKAPTVKAIVRDLSEAEAKALNLRENTARDDLTGPDLAFGIAAMMAEHKKQYGSDITQTALSKNIGMNQPHVGKLMNIMSKMDPKTLKHWREASLQLPINTMYAISKIEGHTEQNAKYQETFKSSTPKEAGEADKLKWLDSAKAKADEFGKYLGALEKAKVIKVIGGIDAFHSENVLQFVKVKSDADDKQIDSVCKRAEKAYTAALNAKDAPKKEEEPNDPNTPRKAGKVPQPKKSGPKLSAN